MRRLLVPGVPVLYSLGLSAFTVGTRVGWQDSGFYLAGVRHLGVLYPPGFALYLILCKAWTLVFGFLDFTLAVHLFSSACAAAAAGALALAAGDLLRNRGLFFTGAAPSEPAAIAAGCLAASGFTFWSAALLAKGYALYYLLLSLVLWRMIRADESGRARDFSIVAVLIGLCWAAHPSAFGVGLAFLLFVVAERRRLGAKGIGLRAGLAAASAIAPSLLLPIFAARHPEVMFGDPSSPGEWLRYLAGSRFTGLAGVFGAEAYRFEHAGRFLWEEFLGVGLLLALVGLVRMAAVNGKLLLGLAAWILPSALLAILFRIEGQLDFWLVVSWLPLTLAVAVGLASIPVRYARGGLPIAAAAGLLWAIGANGRAVSMRTYELADVYGRFHLDNVEPGAILILKSDDALSTAQYLQGVKGLRPDVVLVSPSRFGEPWYLPHLLRRHPELKGGGSLKAFAEANAATRPVYFEVVPPELAASGATLVPAGPLLRMGPSGPPPAPWVLPVRPEEIRARFGRERGIRIELLPNDLVVAPEAYEQRLLNAYIRAQGQQGYLWFRKGGDQNLEKALGYFEAARSADPEHPDADVVNGLALSYYLLKRHDRAEPLLRELLGLHPSPRQGVRACSYLATICRTQGRVQEALRYQDQAMAIIGSDPELRREFEKQAPR